MGFIRSSCLFFLLLIMAIPATAEVYQPGRGILLPSRRNSDEKKPPKIQKAPDSKGVKVIQKGAVVTQGQSPVLNGVQSNQVLNNNIVKQDKDAAILTAAYASHLYTGICAQEYRESLAPKSEKDLNMKQMWADVQASCKCLSNQILTVVPGPDFADYVMYSYGAQKTEKMDPEVQVYLNTGKGDKISDLASNAALRKKCGFLK